MTDITYDTIIQQLTKTIPEFHPDEEDVRDHLTHLVFGDLTRFAKTLVETDDNSELLRRIFSLIEEAAKSGDVRVLDAVRDSFLEGLADSPAHLDKLEKYMGSFTLKLLREAKHYLNS